MAVLLPYALASVQDVKESLGISSGDSSRDNIIIRKINQATEMIEGYCQLAYGHHFAQTTYTNEEYDGSGSNQVSLKMRPVISIASFQFRGTTQNLNDWDSYDSGNYFSDLNAGVIDLLSTQTTDWNRYRITYTAGYAPIPADLAEACVMLASYLVTNADGGAAVIRKREGGREIEYAVSLTSRSLIESLGIDDMLARYINYAILEDK